MDKRTKKIIIIITILGFFVIFYSILQSSKILFHIAAGLDEPSYLYYIVSEKIYKNSANKDTARKILLMIEKGENKHLHDLYIRTVGIIGEDSAFANHLLIDTYSKYQNDTESKGLIYQIIDSMGFVGNKDTVLILERLLKNYHGYRMIIPRYPVVRALYLTTGKNYNYINEAGEKTKLYLTDELKQSRKVIENSKGRYRTVDEMIILDNLNRPEKFKRR